MGKRGHLYLNKCFKREERSGDDWSALSKNWGGVVDHVDPGLMVVMSLVVNRMIMHCICFMTEMVNGDDVYEYDDDIQGCDENGY